MPKNDRQAYFQGFACSGNIQKTGRKNHQKGFGLFHVLCYASVISVASVFLSIVF